MNPSIGHNPTRLRHRWSLCSKAKSRRGSWSECVSAFRLRLFYAIVFSCCNQSWSCSMYSNLVLPSGRKLHAVERSDTPWVTFKPKMPHNAAQHLSHDTTKVRLCMWTSRARNEKVWHFAQVCCSSKLLITFKILTVIMHEWRLPLESDVNCQKEMPLTLWKFSVDV